MSELIIIAFDDEARALAAYEQVQLLQDRTLVELGGIALVRVDERGHLHVETPGRSAELGVRAASSAVFGTVLGALFLMPFLGLAVGGVIGALFAGLDRTTIDAGFRERVAAVLAPGRSAVVAYATAVRDQDFRQALDTFGGSVVQTTLTPDDERAIAHELTELR